MKKSGKKSTKKSRKLACKLAAHVMNGRGDDAAVAPLVWSLAVFFELYIRKGAKGTQKKFGPKEPVEFKVVIND